MIYLYAIIDQAEKTEGGLLGIEQAPLFYLTYQNIAAVVSPMFTPQVLPTRSNVWCHENVIEGLMADHTVLPVRFSTIVRDTSTVQWVLEKNHHSLAANLEQVRGCVEVGLRVLWDGDISPLQAAQDLPKDSGSVMARPGHAYMLKRLEEERRNRDCQQQAETLALQLHTALRHLAVDHTLRVLATPRLLLTAAYLIDQTLVETFRQQTIQLRAAFPHLRLLLTGPWPVYNFVTADMKGTYDGTRRLSEEQQTAQRPG